jgi:chemotaxis protein methyltransferase WspC
MDISPLSIARGQRAVYGRNSFRGQALAFRERHFTTTPEGHRLRDQVRQQVSLQPGNLLDPALKVREGLYDFVFCRNLLIYFDLPTQQRVFEVLKCLTHVQGVLFIGPAEGSLLARLGMRPVGIAQSFAYVRQDKAARVSVAPAGHSPRLAVAIPVLPRPVAALPRAFRPLPGKVVVAPRPDGEDELLRQIGVLADAGNSQQARAACERYLREFAPKAQVYYWLGLLSDTAGDAQQALGHYRKALYLEPQHREALAHLAALLASQGDQAGARRLQARAARADREADQ